ncbi:MAG: nucleoside monophosphate kinase [Cyanobacteria bacterium P01_C01_bin.70]
MKIKQLILLAPPGVPAFEHAALLADRWQISHISMSSLWREAIATDTAISVAARPYLDAEKPVPDELVIKLLRRRLEQPDAMLRGWVMDGFPETVTQAEALHQWLSGMGQASPTVAYLKAMMGILLNRLASQPGQTTSAPAIRRRLEAFQQAVAPLVDYYQQHEQLQTVNASFSFNEVSRALARLTQEHVGAATLIQDEAELDTLIYSQPRLVVDCMASWCGSCKQVMSSIDRLAEEYRDRVNVTKIDFDANRQISKRFGLQGIPAVMFFRDGQLLETLTGVKSYTEYSAATINLLH